MYIQVMLAVVEMYLKEMYLKDTINLVQELVQIPKHAQ